MVRHKDLRERTKAIDYKIGDGQATWQDAKRPYLARCQDSDGHTKLQNGHQEHTPGKTEQTFSE